MTTAALLKLAGDKGIKVRKSWSKPRIRKAIAASIDKNAENT